MNVCLVKVRENPYVEYIEEDEEHVFDMQGKVSDFVTRALPPGNWGLDRINQNSRQLDGDVSFNGEAIDLGNQSRHE